MRIGFGILLIALASSAAALAAGGGTTGRFELAGTVTWVPDGDTVHVRLASGKREEVRLVGIDAAERGDCYAGQARTRARQLALGRYVRLVGDATQATRDRYGRLLAYVVLPGGVDLGRTLIAGGYGRVYVYARPFARVASYRAAEASARKRTRGLWSACPRTEIRPVASPVAPSRTGNCHASDPTVCIPPAPPDLDCGQIPHRRFAVRHDVPDPDRHGFDGDRDGIGCES
jgi:micrococcal nuclease